MQKYKKPQNIITCFVFVVLCALSLAGVWRTLFYGADIDESYALTMAARLVAGDRMLADMWELHQMSALLYTPLVAVYKGITGSMEGALVFMRICGVLIQFFVSVFMYRTLKKVWPPLLAMLVAFAYFNFTPKHIQSPEFSLLFYWAVMVLMLCMLRYADEGKRWLLVGAALSMCVLVLCYPAMLVLYVYGVIRMLMTRERKWRQAAGMITLICAVVCALFLLFVVGGSGITAFENIKFVLMDESHEQSMLLHIWTHILGVCNMLKWVACVVFLCHMLRLLLRKYEKNELPALAGLLFFMIVYAVVQFHTIEHVNFMIWYPIILQLFFVEWYVYVSFPKTETDRLCFEVTMPVMLLCVCAILVSSNVVTQYSMSFFMPGVLLGAWQIYRVVEAGKFEKKSPKSVLPQRIYITTACLLCLCVLLQLFTARIFLVRYTSSQRKNLFEAYYEVTHGVLKGVKLGEFDYQQYETKTELYDRYVKSGDVFLYVGADMFLYSIAGDVNIATGNTISTPAFGTQLLSYYEMYPERIPTVVFADREYCADYSALLLEEPMKTFMETYFDVSQARLEPAVTVYIREKN